MSIDTVREAIDEIQEIKRLVDEGPAHVKLTEAQTRLTDLIAAISTIDPAAIRRYREAIEKASLDLECYASLHESESAPIDDIIKSLDSAILGSKPAQDDGKAEVGDLVAWDALKKLAKEQFEVRAKHAREGKQAGIEAGDTSEVQCFACELQILNRGYDAWLMAYHLMRAAEVKRRIEEAGE